MRNPQWTFFSHITMGEASSFLAWLDRQPSGKVALTDNECPIAGDKLYSMLRVLSSLGFVFERIDCLKIRYDGSQFVQADFKTKMAMLRERIQYLQPTREIINRLKNSTYGRLHKKTIAMHFRESLGEVFESDLQGFYDWARMCELFYYDKQSDEIFCFPQRLTKPEALHR